MPHHLTLMYSCNSVPELVSPSLCIFLVLIELLFLSKQNFAHHIFCNLNKCSRVYKDFAQIGARHEEQEPRLQETRMRSNCAQRLVRPALFCSYRTAAPFPWYGLKTKAAIFVRGSQSNMSQEAGRHQKEWQEQSPRCINTRVFIKLLSLPTQFSTPYSQTDENRRQTLKTLFQYGDHSQANYPPRHYSNT